MIYSESRTSNQSQTSQSISFSQTETFQSALVKGEAGESQQADVYHVSLTYSESLSPMLQLLFLSIVANQPGKKEDD